MRLLSVQAGNFKGFKNLNLTLDGKNTAIFGVNGTGKSSILSVINYVFWRWLNPINPSQSTSYKSLVPQEIYHGSSQQFVQATLEMNGRNYTLNRTYSRARPGKNAVVTYSKKEFDQFVNDFITLYLQDDKTDMPIYVNYGTNRSVLDIPMRIRKKHEFSKIAALEHATDNTLDFRTFFEWYRNQEDIENERMRETGDMGYHDRCLDCVRTAVGAMLNGFSDLRVKRSPPRMVVRKAGIEIQVDQLSDGEKCTLALFGDLARRIAIANPSRENPLQGEGIVLIDEIELHMHPQWQRIVLKNLQSVFPNIQFIVTTHSPQVLGEVDDNFKVYKLVSDERGTVDVKAVSTYGKDPNAILKNEMGTNVRPQLVLDKFQQFYVALEAKAYNEAQEILNELNALLGEDPDVTGMQIQLDMDQI